MVIGLPVHTEARYKVSYLSEMELFWVKSIQVNTMATTQSTQLQQWDRS